MKYFPLLLLAAFIFIVSCQNSDNRQSTPETKIEKLNKYFSEAEASSTMTFEIKEEEEDQWTDTIPNALLFSQCRSHIMNNIEYFDNSGKLILIGRTRFSYDENHEFYLIDLRQHWYRNLSLFIYEKAKQEFVQRETVAEFYGGEGGQILTGSWLVDYDGKGGKDLIRHEVEHWIILEDENTQDTMTAHATLLTWDGNGFLEKEVNSEELVKQYPITLFW